MLFILNKSYEVVGTLNSKGDLSKITTYFDDKYTQDLATGAETFQFSVAANSIQAQHLVSGNFVAFKENGEFKLFNIINIEETHEEIFMKEVYCEMASIELINKIVRPMEVLNSSLRKFLESILEDTEWQLGKMDIGFTQVYDFKVTDYKSVYELIQEYAVGTYGAEISYRVEIENGVVVGKYIDCYAERGKDNGFRFYYGSNLSSVVKTVDSSNLATALIGVGKNGLTFKSVEAPDKPLNSDFIANETAFEQWNINGNHIFGVHNADTESPQELLRLTRIALEERANPQIKYEMKAELLGKNVGIGDTVYVVDHEFNPPLHLNARVNQLITSKTDPNSNEVVLANFKEVNSNITEEMRSLASQLEGYVDSQFPIGGDKIQDGAIGKQQFSKEYHTELIADAVYASLVETEELIAGKADIGDLTAINAKIENLKAEKADITELHAQKAEIEELVATKADIGQLNATNAQIENLKANKADISDLHATNATIGELQANKADIGELNAVKGEITHLKSEVAEIGVIKGDVADIEHILAGNITADNIQTGAITAGSGIIADGAIGNAQISSIDAGKISAGKIDTSKVEVVGTDGHLRIRGNRLQVFNGIGNQAKERVSLGDVNGNGSIYGLRVRGADGTTILLDENGVTSEGITDGSITNDKISDNAEIDGAKLNINSVITKINEDGSETINGTKIEVDGTTLNTKLSTITNKQTEDSEKISQAQSQITANTNAIKLKVDEQTYTENKKDMTSKLEKNTSEISAMKGQIALKVEQADIENAKNEMEGTIDTKVNSAKAEIKATTDKISQNVSNLSQTVSNKADGSTVTAINNKVTSLETSVNGISGKVTNLEKTTTTLGTQVSDAQDTADSAINKANNAQSTANSANSTANANKSNITNLQGEVNTVKSDIASLEVTTSGISQKVSSVESTTATLTTKVTNAQNTANQAKTDASNANSNATNALNKANSASTLADSKAKVFTSTPTTPYKVGDIWTAGPSGDLMKCKTARASGSYVASDWEKASKYTDDTKANAVDGKVNTLQGEVNTVKSNVATLDVNLQGITQRVSSTESTTSTLTSKVNTAQNTADSANSKIDSLKLGSMNIYPNSNFKNNIETYEVTTDTTISYYGGEVDNNSSRVKGRMMRVYSSTGGDRFITDKSLMFVESGQQYTVSFDYFTSERVTGSSSYLYFYDANEKLLTNGQFLNLGITSAGGRTFRRLVKTFTVPSSAKYCRIRYGFICDGACWMTVDGVSIVKGNKDIGWSPSPEDINSAITTVDTKVETTNNKVASIETNLNSITTRVGTVETNQTTVNGKVSSLETRMSTAESKITETAITNTVKKNFYTKSETDSQITSKGYQTASQVQQTVNQLEVKFSSSGGYNLIYNGNFERGLEHWALTTAAQGYIWVKRNENGSPNNPLELFMQGVLDNEHRYAVQGFDWTSNEALTLSWYQWTSANGEDGSNVYRGTQITIGYTDGSNSWHTSGNQTELDVWLMLEKE